MQQKLNILVIGRQAEMLARVSALLNGMGHSTRGAITNDEAFIAFGRQHFDAVLIGGGVDDASRKLFHEEFARMQSSVKILDVSPGTLLDKLQQAFGNPVRE